MRTCLLLSLLLCGCAHSGPAPLTAGRIAGSFTTRDLLWSRTLQLHPDGSFSFYQLSMDTGGRGAAIRFEDDWGVSGSWDLAPPNRIILRSTTGAFTTTISFRLSSNGQVGLLEADGLAAILRSWDAADGPK